MAWYSGPASALTILVSLLDGGEASATADLIRAARAPDRSCVESQQQNQESQRIAVVSR